jgi:peptidoglycan/xylan/chitin deacetylase (PgdA/CDA1 family)
MSGALAENHLTHVAWTTIARDWTLPAPAIAARCLKPASPGAILCFHDGRELAHNPDIRPTLDALTILLPQLTSSGYTLVTLTEMFSPNART